VTAPRQVLPGTTYLVTRRCSERRFLLRPSKTTNRIFLYVLAVAAKRFRIRIHAFCVLSNHFHIVLTDPDANLPAFSQYLDSLVARAINASMGRWESFWAPNSYSAVALLDPDAVVEKIAYVLANPAAAGLVRHGRAWPGLWSDPRQIGGGVIQAERPAVFFLEDGAMPRAASLELSCPAGFESVEAFTQRLLDSLRLAEDRAAPNLAADNRSFAGVARVLAQKPTARPAPGEPRRGLRPRVASRNECKRIEALGRLAEFACAYREALLRWRKGIRDALFPPGTYLLRLAHGVRCASTG
jgi:REP element-mobilizing transposase RayT